MKSKLSLILFCLLIGMSGAFTSCKNEAPDIFVKTADSHTSDFKGIVNAINDETKTVDDRLAYLVGALVAENLTLGEKLDLIEVAIQAGITTYEECSIMLLDALDKLMATEEERLTAIHDILKSSNASLVAKLALIEESVQKGTTTYKDCAQTLIDAINAMNTSLDARLQAIYDILKANEATIDLKLAAIEAAIEKGTGTYKEYAQKLIDEIKLLDRSQAGKLQAIRDILESGLGSVSLKVELVKVAVENGFLSNQEAVAALNKAIVDQLKASNEDLGKSIDDITKAIGEIQGSIDTGFELTNGMIDLIIKNLVDFLGRATTTVGGALDAIEVSIKALSTTITAENKKLLDKLEELKQAVINGNDYSEIIAAIKALTPKPEPEPEPEPEYEFVDLGLKSGTLWATCNLGAEKPEEFGGYYGYGMTKPYAETDEIDWPKYFEYLGGKGTEKNDCGTDKDPLREYVRPDGMFYYIADYPGIEDGIGRTEWDAAYVTSSKLRLPTNAEFLELLRNTISRWTTENGVNGVRFTSKSDSSKSIFLPAAGYDIVDKVGTLGYYLSSTPKEEDMTYCYQLGFDNDIVYTLEDSRRFGVSIRPVYNAPKL